jgi:hypothetical protein
MTGEKEGNSWAEYGKLVLKELERLNSNQEVLRRDIDAKFDEIKRELIIIKNIEISVAKLEEWKEKVDDIISPSQMKELKDEVYRQKNKWTATIAILTFVQILMGILLALKEKLV